MNLKKLNPWNWFRHEENDLTGKRQVPVTRSESASRPAAYGYPDSLLRVHQEMDRHLAR